MIPSNPHCIVEINRAGAASADGTARHIWDSWESPKLFENVRIELVTNATAMVEIRFFDPNFRVIDSYSDRILLGASAASANVPLDTVRVFIGYGSDLGEPIFKGLLARVERGDKTTTLTGYDMGFKMKLLKRAGYKNKKGDLAILRELAQRNGLMFVPPDKPKSLEAHRSMMQDEQTDWEHVMERARDSGLLIYVREDALFAAYPAKVGTPKLTVENRKDFILKSDFDFAFRTPESREGRKKLVSRRGRARGGKRLTGDSDKSKRGREHVVLKRDTPGTHTKAKLSRRAQAQKELDREHAFEGHLQTLIPVETRLDVRDTVRVLEVGKLFSGDYLCDSVTYQFAPGQFDMNLQLYRDVKEG